MEIGMASQTADRIPVDIGRAKLLMPPYLLTHPSAGGALAQWHSPVIWLPFRSNRTK